MSLDAKPTHPYTFTDTTPPSTHKVIFQPNVCGGHQTCGNGPSEIETVMTQMAQYYRPEGVYLMAQSNARLPQYVNGAIWGSPIIGACCGSTPAHVAAMAAALESAKNDPVARLPPIADATKIESADSRAAQDAARRTAATGCLRK